MTAGENGILLQKDLFLDNVSISFLVHSENRLNLFKIKSVIRNF